MLSEEEKKEMLEDVFSKERQRVFEAADKKAERFVQKQLLGLTVDKIIKFLKDAQTARGPFPISKTVPPNTYNFRL